MLFYKHLHLAHKAQELEFVGVIHITERKKYSNSKAQLRGILLQKRQFITLAAAVRDQLTMEK